MTKKKDSTKKAQQSARDAIPKEAYQEAERVAKNLFRLPPKPLKK